MKKGDVVKWSESGLRGARDEWIKSDTTSATKEKGLAYHSKCKERGVILQLGETKEGGPFVVVQFGSGTHKCMPHLVEVSEEPPEDEIT